MSNQVEGGLKILKDVPVPHRAERRSYPFHELEVDECFMVDCADIKQERSVRSSATRYNQLSVDGRRYIVRRMPDTEQTVGVWRIS